MWETIRGYLTFTRKERIGVLFLLSVIFFLFVLPYFFQLKPGDPDPSEYEKLKDRIKRFETKFPDSVQESTARFLPKNSRSVKGNSRVIPMVKPFFFDPNKLTIAEWEGLGLSEKLSHTVVKYVSNGGRFNTATDLKKLYGLKEPDYERLLPWVRIPAKDVSISKGRNHLTNTLYDNSISNKSYQPTNINTADSATWCRLPGIGPKLAGRIIHFREKLGGFYEANQVAETFGLPDSVFQRLKSSLLSDNTVFKKIDLNSTTKEQLQDHPYIRWRLAKAITDYRAQHGNFKSIDDVLQIVQIDSAIFIKIKPYLMVKN